MSSSPSRGHKAGLVRALTLVPATAIIVTNVIGTGVFMKARVMTCNVGTPGLVLLAYTVAGIFTLAGALTFAELSTLMPRAGGQYNYIGASFGRVWAFLFGWTETFIDGAGSTAAIAIVFAVFFNDLIRGALSDRDAQLLAAGIIIFLSALNFASARANGFLASAVTVIKVALILGIAFGAFMLSDGSWAHYAASGAAGTCQGVSMDARLGIAGFGAAIVGALWSYNGWAVVTFVAEEIDNPSRTLPRALIGGTVLLILLYVFVNAAYFYVLTPTEVASVPENTASVAGEVVFRFLGAGAASVMAIGLMFSSFGALHSNILTVGRVPFALARNGLLPRWAATVSKHTRVPIGGVLIVGVFAVAFSLSGTFDVLTDLIVFGLLIFNGLAVAAVFVLRRKLPDAPRPYKAWGYPIVPLLFLLATVYLMLNTLFATPGRALVGLAIIASGLPVYAYYARKRGPSRMEDFLGEDDDESDDLPVP